MSIAHSCLCTAAPSTEPSHVSVLVPLRGRELIRSAGDSLRLLVAKMEPSSRSTAC